MLRWLVYEEEYILLEDVLDHEKLADNYPSTYLADIIDIRVWDGKPSVTQLIKGSRAAYLEVVVPYAEKPDDSSYRFVGNQAHTKLELAAVDPEMAEKRMSMFDITGMSDYVHIVKNKDGSIKRIYLWDYKVWGAFAINKTLGRYSIQVKAMDKFGNPEFYQKATKYNKKGDPKMVKEYRYDEAKADDFDVKMQVNMYRLLLSDYGIELIKGRDKMKVFMINREGGLASDVKQGLTEKIYRKELSFVKDEIVEAYFVDKRNILVNAIEAYRAAGGVVDPKVETYDEQLVGKFIPDECNTHEAWGGSRCAKFCPVSEACKKYGCSYLR